MTTSAPPQRAALCTPQSVEVAFLDGGMVGVRDSKNRTGPALVFTPGEWEAFTAGVRDGEFERP